MTDPDIFPDGDEEAQVSLTLPLDAWHRAAGGRMVEFAGYWMPVQYEGIIAEHAWTRTSAGLFDVSHMGQLEVSGEGAMAALEALVPADLAGLQLGRLRYSLLLDENGGILDDLMVTNAFAEGGGDHYFLVVNGATKWDDIAHLREHLPDEITLNHLDDHGLLALQGPKAAAVLATMGLEPAFAGMVAVDELGFMQAGAYFWKGRPLGVSRSGYTGEDGFEISVRVEDITALADALCAAPEVKPIGLGARDSLRLEAGLPLYGHDLSPETDPVSAGLSFAINKRRRGEGGFPGARIILPLLADGAPVQRVGLALAGRMAAREGAQIFVDNHMVGHVTSGGFSPSLNHPIAMGYVAAAQAAVGTALEIDVRGKRLAAQVVPIPFVSHRYFRKGASR
ncbi:MAG: glycine cleavage system aminomethyltransferase GcvT [Pseudomonadota bacterium]|nr:glycine cleavage system aminomethyltransferase GcvT [Pseudomonadota bacterium]